MQATVSASQLADLLELLITYRSPIDSQPSTYSVLLDVRDDHLVLGMVGLKHCGIVGMPSTIGEEGQALVPPEALLAAVKRDEDADVTLSSGLNGRLRVQWEGAEDWAEIEGNTAETFLRIDAAPTTGYLELTLSEAMLLVSVPAAVKSTEYAFLELSTTDSGLRCAAASRSIASFADVSGDWDLKQTWFLPVECLPILKSVARALRIDPKKRAIRITTRKGYAYIVFPNGMFRSALPADAKHIPLEKLLAVPIQSIAKVDSVQLNKDLSAAFAIAGKDDDATMTLSMSKGGIQIQVANRAIGQCDYTIPVTDYSGEEATMLVAPSTLLQATRSLVKGSVHIRYGAPFLQVADNDHTVILKTRAN